ncbi:carboxymuconolactone decarboxylase family protein [Pseudomaricurvus sp. HS19]|uniref:carboxymuconolactone decarboxylase family protein n=1 Tax=Pseudomaricurvus sp. HS19 TaxID=2692626 RepID=UPI0013718CB4|nr:carboxymuconolactone decarboxylase family protein [Pseudomaricurvus sp. HS19]MYM63041.1 hypothetical protein [Pseudomaricurvus sp. HS19]
MFNAIARKFITAFGRRYDFDVSYQLYLADHSGSAFRTFARACKLGWHRQRVSPQVAMAVQLVAIQFEDCGSCTELMIKLAREAGMEEAEINTVLSGHADGLQEELALACRYARTVLRHEESAGVLEEVRQRWGEQGVIDLAMAVLGARLYPQMKWALGFASPGAACAMVGGRPALMAAEA